MIHVINWFVNILTLGLVSIATITTTTYHVDEPIEELNNLTLNEVFLDGNDSLIDNITILANQTVEFSYLQNTNLYNINDEIYIYYNQVNDISQSSRNTIAIQYDVNPDFGSFVNNNNQNAGVYSYLTPIERTYQFIAIYTNNLSVETIYNNIKLINLTTLGIDNLNKNQIDDWVDIYQQAVANNGVYIESTSHLNNNIHLVDVSVMVISFGLWTWLYKFLKGVVL